MASKFVERYSPTPSSKLRCPPPITFSVMSRRLASSKDTCEGNMNWFPQTSFSAPDSDVTASGGFLAIGSVVGGGKEERRRSGSRNFVTNLDLAFLLLGDADQTRMDAGVR